MSLRRGMIAALLLAGLTVLGARADTPLEPLSAFPRSLLEIKTRAGSVHHFSIWIADRPARQEQGLMFVRQLPDHTGMLFPYRQDRRITMWMKNTLIPLDMVFIGADGRIAHIAASTTPQSLDIIAAPDPVRAVLELAGGSTQDLGIRVGDQVYSDALPASRRRSRTP